jgi:tetratricopeptide (TPR) repeat protein
MLRRGLQFLNEPIFAFDLYELLVNQAKEQRKRGIMQTSVSHYLELLELALPNERLLPAEQARRLASLSGYSDMHRLFQGEVHLRLGRAQFFLNNSTKARESLYLALKSFQSLKSQEASDKHGAYRGAAEAARELARIALSEDDHGGAELHIEVALAACDAGKLLIGRAHCLKTRGEIAYYRSQLRDAEKDYLGALTIFEQAGAKFGEANTRVAYARLLISRQQLEEAEEHTQKAMAAYEAITVEAGIANCKKMLAETRRELHRYDEAVLLADEAIALYEKLGSRSGVANAKLIKAKVFQQLKRYKDAWELTEEARKLYRSSEVRDGFGEASALRSLGEIQENLGNVDKAIDFVREALGKFEEVNSLLEVANSVVILVNLLEKRGFSDQQSAEESIEMLQVAVDTLKLCRLEQKAVIASTLLERLQAQVGLQGPTP